MLSLNKFGFLLKNRKYQFFTGVPCSFLKGLINYAINEAEYIACANEGDAVAVASGASLGGKKSIVLMQNSGLTNATSPLTSLNHTFQLPVLGFVSLRGEEGLQDEPQHELMGKITTDFLDIMKIKWAFLPSNLDDAEKALQEADYWIEKNQTFFFVVKKGTFEEEPLKEQSSFEPSKIKSHPKVSEDELPGRYEALQKISSIADPDTLVIATTGHTGRELYDILDAPNNVYMVGSMGCASSLAMGLALARPDKKVVVIDGDGALLMRMGAAATLAYYHPPNLFHLLLDNQCHGSTGGQNTVSSRIDFIALAQSLGYPFSSYIHSLDELEKNLQAWNENQILSFSYLKIRKGSKKPLGRPKVKPHEIKTRLMQFIKDEKSNYCSGGTF